jgi:thiamine-phosphate pyrophosphorylase
MKLPRVYPILDGALLTKRGASVRDSAAALLDGGATLIQLRWKEHFHREIFADSERIAQLCRDFRATLIVNDRADVAVMLDAGVHVGQGDIPPEYVRRIVGPNRPIGLSTHNETQFAAADREPVDYIALGPIFTTASKVNPDPVVGTAELRRLRGLSGLPVVAIGGITRATAREVWQAGADSVAVIGDLYPDDCTPASLRERFEEWMRIGADE